MVGVLVQTILTPLKSTLFAWTERLWQSCPLSRLTVCVAYHPRLSRMIGEHGDVDRAMQFGLTPHISIVIIPQCKRDRLCSRESNAPVSSGA
jgi:hypothetical protein